MRLSKEKIITVAIVAIIVIGVCVMLYPTVADWYNSKKQTAAVSTYVSAVEETDSSVIENLLTNARAFNSYLFRTNHGIGLTDEELEDYNKELLLSTTDVMAYIEIESINVYLPIYHGTSDTVLAVGVGHMEGTSLPVGGESTHCVLTAHTGLSTSKLFTDVDQLEIGDTFVIYVLGETLTYEVDQILIVDPDDATNLLIVEGEDYVTLFTCYPYGVNSHRMLVRGHRIENIEDDEEETGGDAIASDDNTIDITLIVTFSVIFVAVIILLIVLRQKRPPRGIDPYDTRAGPNEGGLTPEERAELADRLLGDANLLDDEIDLDDYLSGDNPETP